MIGSRLKHYEIEGRLGKGGMGDVFVAHDTKLQRKVALKVLPAEFSANADRRARFEREAQAVAALNHPNIVTVFSVEQADDVHFITMERVEGLTLTELLPRGGFSLDKLLEIVSWMKDGRILYGSDASGNADCWIMNADGTDARRLTSDPAADHSPVPTPDGESFVFVSFRSGSWNLWTLDLDGSPVRQLTHGDFNHQPDVSPDGRWVVYSCGVSPAAVCRIPFEGGEPERLSRNMPEPWGMGPSISPDGSRIAYSTPDTGIEIISIDGGDVLVRQGAFTELMWNVDRWTPDGKSMNHLYYEDGVRNLYAIPVGGGLDDSVQRTFLDGPDTLQSFAWSPDGTQVVLMTAGESRQIVLLEGF